MGKRGPVPQKSYTKVMSGNLPMTKANGTFEQFKNVTAPDAPSGLSRTERKIWDQTIAILAPIRILEKQDAAVLEAFCRSYVRWHDAEAEIRKQQKRRKKDGLVSIGANGTCVINPLINISRRERSDTVTYAQQLGMTPAARMRLDLEGSTAADKKAGTFQKLKKLKDERMGNKSQKLRKRVDTQEERE